MTNSILPPILEKQLQVHFLLTPDHSISQTPYHYFFFHLIKLPKLKFWFAGSLLSSQNFAYQVKNELCLLPFKTCNMSQPTRPHLALLISLRPFFHQTKLLPNSIIIIWSPLLLDCKVPETEKLSVYPSCFPTVLTRILDVLGSK